MNFLKPLLLTLTSLAFITFLYSCSEPEENNLSIALQQKVLTEEIFLKEFARKHIFISKEISELLFREENISFDENSRYEILQLRSESDLIEYFSSKGIITSELIVDKLKNLKLNYAELIENLPFIAELEINEQERIIEAVINEEYDNLHSYPTSGRTCKEQHDIDIGRCERNHMIGLGFSYAAGWLTGGLGGLLGAATSITVYHFCVEDANEDWRACSGN